MPSVFSQNWMILILALSLLMCPAPAGATALGEFRTDIRLYRDGVEELLQQGQPGPRFFLEAMKQQAEYLDAFSHGLPPTPFALDKEIADFVRLRLAGQEQRPVEDDSARRQEEALWTLLVEPYLEEAYLRRLVRERRLLERRSYDLDVPESANFIEEAINDHVGFLQFRQERKWYRQAGVPLFEATAGFEPFVLVEGDNPLGIMADIGLLYHLFPEVRQSEANRYLSEPHYEGWLDRLLARHLRKVGFRIGAGALFDGPTPAYGVGVRLRSLTLWGIYSSGDTEYSLAIGFSDFEWLKKINFAAPF